VHRFPTLSHFQRALADDRDLVSSAEPAARERPMLRSWGPHEEHMAVLIDGFNLVQHAIAASVTPAGKKLPPFKPVPRPLTAASRVARDERRKLQVGIVTKVLPAGG
jgi:hypothetical protein